MPRRILTIVALVAAVSGCEATVGGAGETARGEPVVGEVYVNFATGEESFTISSVRGWTCEGVLTEEQKLTVSSVISVPLKCDRGLRGTSIVSVDRVRGVANANFRLSNGVIGNVRFGGA